MQLHKPVVYQEAKSEVRGPKSEAQDETPKSVNRQSTIDHRQFVEGHYALDAQNHVRFELGPYDHNRPLVIDPVLVYATYVGGSGGDIGYAIAVDSNLDAYIAGVTNSTNFPTAGGPVSVHLQRKWRLLRDQNQCRGNRADLFHLSWRQPVRHRHGPCREQRRAPSSPVTPTRWTSPSEPRLALLRRIPSR